MRVEESGFSQDRFFVKVGTIYNIGINVINLS